ncbi:hypothetical protein LCGC14_2005900 [marine sediment metagenome]|uniref:Uncharacterized protein n=1 Tax=marine sediment metagenome TaxID=412755 RepID=A0A0F9F1X0_9ZZZZ
MKNISTTQILKASKLLDNANIPTKDRIVRGTFVFNKVAYFYEANQNNGTITIVDRMNV